MLPFIAVGVIVGASCVAWYYNCKTEDEKRNQEYAYNERESLYANYQRASTDQTEQARQECKRLAEQCYLNLLKTIKVHEGKFSPIKEGLDELFKLISTEIIADSTSPYRKSALRREFARTEDAYMRLEQYKQYLVYERQIINELWMKERYVLMPAKTRRKMTMAYAGEYPYFLLNKKRADLSPLCFLITARWSERDFVTYPKIRIIKLDGLDFTPMFLAHLLHNGTLVFRQDSIP